MTATIFDLGAVPVIVPDMPEADYHASPALSSTGARTLLDCPARFDWQRRNPRPHKDTFDFGTAVHTLTLGAGWVIEALDFDDWRTKAAREAADEIRANGGIPMLRKDYDVAKEAADAVHAHPAAGPLMRPADDRLVEASMFAEDPTTGVAMRARVDMLAPDVMIDLKTARSADPEKFGRDAATYGYQVQMAWYQHVARLCGRDAIPFLFVVVENVAPYLVNVIELDGEFARIGRAQMDRALQLYAVCTETGKWPGYERDDGEPNVVGPPAWLSYSEGMEL